MSFCQRHAHIPVLPRLNALNGHSRALPYIFIAKLVSSQVDGAKGASSNLLLDDILVDTVLCRAVVLARPILGAGVQCFLCAHETRISLSPESLARAVQNVYQPSPDAELGGFVGGVFEDYRRIQMY